MKRISIIVLLVGIFALIPGLSPALAQTYSFSLDQQTVDYFIQSDGTMVIHYAFVFTNDSFASPMDFIDVGLPSGSRYSLNNVSGSVDGHPIRSIEDSPYVSPGIALGLGSNAIRPGRTGTVSMAISGVTNVLFVADVEGYVSTQVSPTWFDSEFVQGTTDLTVRFHFPPNMGSDEPRWFDPPSGWPQSEPSTGFDSEGRILYVWRNNQASGSSAYRFGVAFPQEYVPEGSYRTPTITDRVSIPGFISDIFANPTCCCFGGFLLFFFGMIALGQINQRRAKMKYLPPKISIEGHGIKRGLTAVEAAILLETPLDRVLTMILFSLVKKGAAKVVTEDPLKIERLQPAPEGLRKYETDFLEAMDASDDRKRKQLLQEKSIELIRAVQTKMKGFSLKESKEYYKAIIDKAWSQVEAAQTPEVKSEKFAEDLEWTMLDDDFDNRTRRTFERGPVFMPPWWIWARPSYSRPAGGTVSAPARPSSGRAGGVSLPTLPGGEFAASIVTGVQETAGNLVSNVSDFTGGVTRKTNPPPVRTSSGGSSRGGSGCACACACAGCACACAGGGR